MPTGVPVHAVPVGDLAAICAPAQEEEREITADTLWRHEQVVEALMQDRDLLPVRFGTRLDDDAAAARSLAGRRDEFKRALEHVRGAVELSVRAVFLDTVGGVEPTGKAGERTEKAGTDAVRSGRKRLKKRCARCEIGCKRRNLESMRDNFDCTRNHFCGKCGQWHA